MVINTGKYTTVLTQLLLILTISSLMTLNNSQSTPINPSAISFLGNIRIAYYNGNGAWVYDNIVIPNLVDWFGTNLTMVRGEDIKGGILDDFDILIWPGGSYPTYWDELGLEGKAEIQKFVSNGGGYLGICAGAYYAADYIIWKRDPAYPDPPYKVEGNETNLDLFPGVAIGPISQIGVDPLWGWAMTQINIVNHTHPITVSLPDSMQILYAGGPNLQPYEEANVTILGTYERTESPAIVTCYYGDGRVFLISPHAEIEEDSDRDGVKPFPMLTDEESDWPLLLEAAKWLVNSVDHPVTGLSSTSALSTTTREDKVSGWSFYLFILLLGLVYGTRKFRGNKRNLIMVKR
ncbi:MAG: BPL-N domain-containing protein [Promethearchaeota archaeon]